MQRTNLDLLLDLRSKHQTVSTTNEMEAYKFTYTHGKRKRHLSTSPATSCSVFPCSHMKMPFMAAVLPVLAYLTSLPNIPQTCSAFDSRALQNCHSTNFGHNAVLSSILEDLLEIACGHIKLLGLSGSDLSEWVCDRSDQETPLLFPSFDV